MSVTEPSDVFNAGMAKQNKGCRLTWNQKLSGWLVGWLAGHTCIQRSVLSVRNGVLLYKQLIHPVMGYTCPIWRSAASTYSRKLQVLQSKCFCIATNAPWFTGHGQIIEDFGVLFFADHIRSLTERFNSDLADVRNLSVRHLRRCLR